MSPCTTHRASHIHPKDRRRLQYSKSLRRHRIESPNHRQACTRRPHTLAPPRSKHRSCRKERWKDILLRGIPRYRPLLPFLPSRPPLPSRPARPQHPRLSWCLLLHHYLVRCLHCQNTPPPTLQECKANRFFASGQFDPLICGRSSDSRVRWLHPPWEKARGSLLFISYFK